MKTHDSVMKAHVLLNNGTFHRVCISAQTNQGRSNGVNYVMMKKIRRNDRFCGLAIPERSKLVPLAVFGL